MGHNQRGVNWNCVNLLTLFVSFGMQSCLIAWFFTLVAVGAHPKDCDLKASCQPFNLIELRLFFFLWNAILPDGLVWNCSRNGGFELKSSYKPSNLVKLRFFWFFYGMQSCVMAWYFIFVTSRIYPRGCDLQVSCEPLHLVRVTCEDLVIHLGWVHVYHCSCRESKMHCLPGSCYSSVYSFISIIHLCFMHWSLPDC